MRKVRLPLNIVSLYGGTGNVLFQISYAHRLAARSSQRIYLLKLNRGLNDHSFELSDFISKCDHVKEINGIFAKLLNFYLFARNRLTTNSVGQAFARVIPSKKFASFHEGYFQDESDLLSVSNEFKRELVSYLEARHSQSTYFSDFDLVIHLRRGDYEKYVETFGILSSEYFKVSMDTLSRRMSLNTVAVFYDTLDDESKEDFVLPSVRYFGPNDANALELLYGFLCSKSCIISNSTLSWWGGQLALMRSATAISPKPWHKSLPNDFEVANRLLGFVEVEATYR